MAVEIPLAVEVRTGLGSSPSRRLRHAGKIPGIVYGHGTEPIPVEIDAPALRHALNTESGANALLRLEIDGKHHLALARALQKHPIKQTVTHVDLQIVSRDEIVASEVSVVLTGDAIEVHRADGTVEQVVFALTVKAKPADIPLHFEVDVTGLEIGGAIRVGDLAVPKGVTIELDPEEIVVAAHAAKGYVEGELAEAEAAAVAAVAADGAEGGESEGAPAEDAGESGD
ncbi:MAG TPA: 50S ribosomal protein L25 [Acidimicrobiales bacterium]|nr:50S ribosomal protein L25 [Acidimicrobiales bacterium]